MPFKVYRSSAGSGKTFTLVKEYLRLALATDKADNYRGILAVTFTNKAAEEMKSRVLEYLGAISNSDIQNHTMAQILIAELEISESKIVDRAANVLKHMLHHYSDLSISTIDKFSHKLIRTFSQDLGLSMNFEVELDTDVLTQNVLDELMNHVGSEPLLTEALIDLVASTTEDEKGWNIDKPLKDFIKILFTEESRFHLEQLQKIDLKEFAKLRNNLRKTLTESKQELKAIGKSAISSAKECGLTAKSFHYTNTGIYGYMAKLSNGGLKPPGIRITSGIENDKWYGTRSTSEEKSAIDGLRSDWASGIARATELIRSITYHQVVFNHIYGVALLDEMQRILTKLQHENEVVHIGEFNHLINNVVMTESAPFIYERIGARYHHFLIDEFQDTSILQWFNLLPLIDESLAHNNLCLVVGDAKQSIYRWRGGDVQQFVRLPIIHKPAHVAERLSKNPHLETLFHTREKAIEASKDIQKLDSNFRSNSTVVHFNNSLFESLQAGMPASFASMYDESAQVVRVPADGLVTVQMLRPESSNRSWPEYDGLVQGQLGNWIDECKEDGYAFGDMAIIFRTNKDAVKTALFLIENGYNVVSNESLLINSSSSVRLLVNLAVYQTDPTNTTNICELLENLVELKDDRQNLSEHLMESLGGKETRYIHKLLKDLFPNVAWDDLEKESPFSFFSILIHGLFADSTEPHLSFFLNEVLAFTQSKRKSMGDFLDFWFEKRNKLSIALEKNENAINIITIHKSKGLEFPVVMHPYADYPTRSGKNFIWTYLNDELLKPLDRIRISSTSILENTPFSGDHELEKALESMDMFNELYVSLTRAKERLYLSGKLKGSSSADADPSTAIQFVRKHLITEYGIGPEQLEFTIGVRNKAEATEINTSGLKLRKTGDPFWKNRISLANPAMAHPDSNVEPNARLRGIAIHDALANIKTPKDIDGAVISLVEAGRISTSEMADLIKHISNLLERDELKPLFAEGMRIRNEADIQLATGQWVRPDRVVSKNQCAWVIDYKTGVERADHKRQIEDYRSALMQLGFEVVEGLLVYLDSENVVHV